MQQFSDFKVSARQLIFAFLTMAAAAALGVWIGLMISPMF